MFNNISTASVQEFTEERTVGLDKLTELVKLHRGERNHLSGIKLDRCVQVRELD